MTKKFKIECYILKIDEHHDYYDSSQIERLLNEGWKVKNFCACTKPSINSYVVVYLERKVKVEDE